MGATVAGVVATTTATADPFPYGGGVAQIATKSVDGVRYCIIPTGELRQCDFGSTPRNRYIFQDTNCGSEPGTCYRIRLSWSPGQCLYYDTFTAGSVKIHKIGYRTCELDNERHRWLIKEVDGGWVQLRPASHTARCVGFDPSSRPAKPPADGRIIGSTSVKKCSSHPTSHTRFKVRR